MSKKRPLSPPSPTSSESNDKDDASNTYTTRYPFHVDLTSHIAYYTSFHAKVHGYDVVEEVALGDTIAVALEDYNYTGYISAFSSQVCKSGDGLEYFPFNQAWSPCEVVCIYREVKKEDAKHLHRMIVSKGNANTIIPHTHKNLSATHANELMMEIRWLYRNHELKKTPHIYLSMSGDNQKLLTSPDDDLVLDEIVETDHIDECHTESFIGKVCLYEEPSLSVEFHKIYTECAENDRAPTYPFQCKQFWSSIQKSYFTCGSLNSRIGRGRMYSTHFNDGALKNALCQCQVTGEINLVIPVGKDSVTKEGEMTFKNQLTKAALLFSLSDASSKAKDSILCGREKEHNQIATFVRTAIASEGEPSIFVAGPPGTGKQACIIT